MITIEESIPSKTEAYIAGEDIFYVQFNDINFYIEDEEQENFFFCILKNLFPDIRIEKIFPLLGKDNVIEESRENIGNKKKVYIVDMDFDDILGKIEENSNLFYIERYCIENYLLEKNAIVEYVIGERPRLSKRNVINQLDFEACIDSISQTITKIVHLHIVVQEKCNHLKNVSLNPERFVQFRNNAFSITDSEVEKYKNDIQAELDKIDKRLSVNGQYNKVRKLLPLKTIDQCLKHIPGKYLIKMVKQRIESMFNLASRNCDSFCYRVAEKCSFQSLNFLKQDIGNYISD